MTEQRPLCEVTPSANIVFIAAGCTYETYTKVLKHVLGIKVVSSSTFMTAIETLHPVVEEMVNELCEREKKRMKDDKLGSWKRAVTCADGTWMTRGFHSQNATYSIRNYFTGALLYYKHICQKGSVKILGEELYKGTSKSADGYSARVLVQTAKEEGMTSRSTGRMQTSKPFKENFPRASLMTCGGHAGRAHLYQLQTLAKSKTFTKGKTQTRFPGSRDCGLLVHKTQGGMRMPDGLLLPEGENNILSTSQSPQEFFERLRNMVHHVQGVHEWEGGQCQFHSLSRVCSCAKCPDKNQPQCKGKEYTTRDALFTCWCTRSSATLGHKWRTS